MRETSGRCSSEYAPRRESAEQRRVAEDVIADASGFWGAKVVTKISQAGPFWEAEAEDQDYLQRYTDGDNRFSPYRSAAR